MQLPYGRGRGFIQRSHGGAEISVQMPHPGTTLKIAFFCHLWLRPKLLQCYVILFEEAVYLKCMLLERNIVFKLGGWTFSYYGRRGGTSKTQYPLKCNLLKQGDQ